MLRGVFVTGTDTGVGKTVVSAALMCRLRGTHVGASPARPRATLRYWKPIQTGVEQDDDTAEVGRLAACPPEELLNDGVRLPRLLSPHLAARLAGRPIVLDEVLAMARAAPPVDSWVIEGAGGVLVPINDRDLMVDLVVALALPVVVVARSGLGTINHTLLTLEALGRRGLRVAGVVMVGERSPANREAIEWHGHAQVLGELPVLSPLTTGALAAWAASELDVGGILQEWSIR